MRLILNFNEFFSGLVLNELHACVCVLEMSHVNGCCGKSMERKIWDTRAWAQLNISTNIKFSILIYSNLISCILISLSTYNTQFTHSNCSMEVPKDQLSILLDHGLYSSAQILVQYSLFWINPSNFELTFSLIRLYSRVLT